MGNTFLHFGQVWLISMRTFLNLALLILKGLLLDFFKHFNQPMKIINDSAKCSQISPH